jgi:hypothetical protein
LDANYYSARLTWANTMWNGSYPLTNELSVVALT